MFSERDSKSTLACEGNVVCNPPLPLTKQREILRSLRPSQKQMSLRRSILIKIKTERNKISDLIRAPHIPTGPYTPTQTIVKAAGGGVEMELKSGEKRWILLVMVV